MMMPEALSNDDTDNDCRQGKKEEEEEEEYIDKEPLQMLALTFNVTV